MNASAERLSVAEHPGSGARRGCVDGKVPRRGSEEEDHAYAERIGFRIILPSTAGSEGPMLDRPDIGAAEDRRRRPRRVFPGGGALLDSLRWMN